MTPNERIKAIIGSEFVGKELEHVQIKVGPGTLDFEGKPGWLRYQSDLQHSKSLEVLCQEKYGKAIAGEWLIGNNATARLTIEDGVQTVRVIEEREPSGPDADWLDSLAESDEVHSRMGNDKIGHRIYYGFRKGTDDAETGNIRRIAERMNGWSVVTAPEKGVE